MKISAYSIVAFPWKKVDIWSLSKSHHSSDCGFLYHFFAHWPPSPSWLNGYGFWMNDFISLHHKFVIFLARSLLSLHHQTPSHTSFLNVSMKYLDSFILLVCIKVDTESSFLKIILLLLLKVMAWCCTQQTRASFSIFGTLSTRSINLWRPHSKTIARMAI